VLLLLVGLAPVIAARPAHAQTETVLYSFTVNDGFAPTAGLTSDGAGNFFGTTVGGGPLELELSLSFRRAAAAVGTRPCSTTSPEAWMGGYQMAR